MKYGAILAKLSGTRSSARGADPPDPAAIVRLVNLKRYEKMGLAYPRPFSSSDFRPRADTTDIPRLCVPNPRGTTSGDSGSAPPARRFAAVGKEAFKLMGM